MMLRRGREFLRTLLILVIILALYGAYKWGFGSEARYDRAGKGRFSVTVNSDGITC